MLYGKCSQEEAVSSPQGHTSLEEVSTDATGVVSGDQRAL